MNKHIKQFERESGLDVYALGLDKAKWESRLEKFAELIVAECAEIAKHNVMNISTYADAEFVDQQIKKHFGVEE